MRVRMNKLLYYYKMFKFILSVMVSVRSVMSEYVVIETAHGTIIGRKHSGYDTFFGVPYARVDPNNVFGEPLDQPEHLGTFVANDSTTMCPQVNTHIGGTLDCLRLNMYVPQTMTIKRAVLVWFPSSFTHGRAGDFGGQHLAKEDIIVIIVNYRLGVYGFACINEPKIPANMALRDQDAALRWVQKNIGYFGGDPTEVTIGGQGYAGGFIDVHLYSQLDILFNKVIIQSGSIFAQGFFGDPNPGSVLEIAKYFGLQLGPKTKPRDVLKFLSKITPVEVVNVADTLNLRWTICKEKYYEFGINNFITKNPFQLGTPKSARATKILIGYNNMELLGAFSRENNSTIEFYKSIKNIFYERINRTFNLPDKDRINLSKLVKKFYLGGKEVGQLTRKELIDSGSDLYINHAVEMSVNRYVDADATVYKYLFSYTGGSKFSDIFVKGASNGDELKYLFEMHEKIQGETQEHIRKELITYWANFIKYGNPTPVGKPLVWTPVTGDKRPYLDINEKSEMLDHVFRERMVFLDLLYYVYVKYAIVH